MNKTRKSLVCIGLGQVKVSYEREKVQQTIMYFIYAKVEHNRNHKVV